MNEMREFKSRKLYYEDPWGIRCISDWRRIDASRIAVAQSIAYPEGGGEAPDIGRIVQGDRMAIFRDVQRIGGASIKTDGVKPIASDGEIQIQLETPIGDDWDVSRPIEIEIDGEHRIRKARSHSAAHLLYIAAQEIIPDGQHAITGWSVQPDNGRFEIVGPKIGEDELSRLTDIVSEWVESNHAIRLEPFEGGDGESRIWICNGIEIPCGGNHISRTAQIGRIALRKKSQGKNRTRIYYTLEPEVPAELLNLVTTAST